MDYLVDRIIRIPPPPPHIVHSCLARSSFLSSVLGTKIFDKKKKRRIGIGKWWFIFSSRPVWGPVSMLVESRACWKMFLFHPVGKKKVFHLLPRGCGIYASSTISANRFTPTDRGKSVSLHCLRISSRGNIPRFHLNFPPTFDSLSLSLTVCSNESHLRYSRINGGVRLSLDDETCIYRDFQKWIFNLGR